MNPIKRWLKPARAAGSLTQAELPSPDLDAELTLDSEPTEEVHLRSIRSLQPRPPLRSWRHHLLTFASAAAATMTTVQMAGLVWVSGPTPGTVAAAPVALLLWGVTVSRVVS